MHSIHYVTLISCVCLLQDQFNTKPKFRCTVNTCFCAVYVYKSLNNLSANKYFKYRTNPFYSLRNPDLLRLPASRSMQSQSFIGYHGAKIWNALTPDIRNKSTLQSFKAALKQFLLNKYSDSAAGWITYIYFFSFLMFSFVLSVFFLA